MVQIEIIFNEEDCPGAYELWGKIKKNIPDILLDKEFVDGFSGRVFSFGGVSDFLKGRDGDDFFIEIGDAVISYASVHDLGFSRLDIKNVSPSEEEAENWVLSSIEECGFVQARIYNYNYDLWQNMEDLAYYESEGKSHDRLPKKNNGLPFPLDAMVVDVSDNPGRWELKDGYIESVGSTMWISKKLLNRLDSDVFGNKCDDRISIIDLGSFVRVKAQDFCFKSCDGEEGVLQNLLRNMIYKNKS